MLNFNDWVKNNYGEENVSENATKRGGTKYWAYPPQYVRGQYPSNYFPPYSATAAYNMGPTADQAKMDKQVQKVDYKNFKKTEA